MQTRTGTELHIASVRGRAYALPCTSRTCAPQPYLPTLGFGFVAVAGSFVAGVVRGGAMDEHLSRRMVTVLRKRKIKSNVEGKVKVNALSRYLRCEEADILACVAASHRTDNAGEGEWYFSREKFGRDIWVSVIESRRHAARRDAQVEADAAAGSPPQHDPDFVANLDVMFNRAETEEEIRLLEHAWNTGRMPTEVEMLQAARARPGPLESPFPGEGDSSDDWGEWKAKGAANHEEDAAQYSPTSPGDHEQWLQPTEVHDVLEPDGGEPAAPVASEPDGCGGHWQPSGGEPAAPVVKAEPEGYRQLSRGEPAAPVVHAATQQRRPASSSRGEPAASVVHAAKAEEAPAAKKPRLTPDDPHALSDNVLQPMLAMNEKMRDMQQQIAEMQKKREEERRRADEARASWQPPPPSMPPPPSCPPPPTQPPPPARSHFETVSLEAEGAAIIAELEFRRAEAAFHAARRAPFR